tara:strand:- start:7081 stop:7545 length:465 start_codon:yes stop_codon:yes gene_type:complete
MIKINVLSNNSAWKNYIRNPNTYFEQKLKEFNLRNKLYKNKIIFCTLLLSGDLEIKKLNKKFRKKNKTTDILSFPFYNKQDLKKKISNNKEIYLGDIIINLNKIKFKKEIKNFKKEFNKLWIHGLVHLFGYDHKKNKDFQSMLKIEKRFLSYLN